MQRCKVEKIRAIEIECEVIGELKKLSKDRTLLEELAKKSHSLSAQTKVDKKSLLHSREQARRKIEHGQKNALGALGGTSNSDVHKLILKNLEDDAKELESINSEIALLKQELQDVDNLVDLSGVFGVLKKFYRNFDKLPTLEKHEALSSIVRQIVVSPEKISMEIYGAKVEAPRELKLKTPGLGGLGSDVRGSGVVLNGRGDRIRTCDLMLPKHARYQLRYAPNLLKSWEIISTKGLIGSQ